MKSLPFFDFLKHYKNVSMYQGWQSISIASIDLITNYLRKFQLIIMQ